MIYFVNYYTFFNYDELKASICHNFIDDTVFHPDKKYLNIIIN